jgi:hypothetical protein
MKIYTSKYRNHWISPYTILKTVCFWEKDEDVFYNLNDKPNSKYVKWVNFLDPICVAWQKFLDFVHPRFQYVKIDFWDTWSMDHTLADIVLPMLKQLKETKHGAPMTDDEDVPDNLKSTSAKPKEEEWDTDEFHFERWDWILDEMIWAFEQKATDDDESPFFDHSENEPGGFPWDRDGNYVSKTKVDWEGLKAHQARKTNGYRLFGKYYEALWD